MITVDELKALIVSHGSGDNARFYAVAMQAAAKLARAGHGKAAKALRELIDSSREDKNATATYPAIRERNDSGNVQKWIVEEFPKTRLADMQLDDIVIANIELILLEQRQRWFLRQRALEPLRKLLLAGLPGTGKTMLARMLAGELGLPLCKIQADRICELDDMQNVFYIAASRRGVYLLDDLDAMRDVNQGWKLRSFISLLEEDHSDSLIIAATRNLELQGRATVRRFHVVLNMNLPNSEIAERIIRTRLAMLDTSRVDWPAVRIATRGLSHAALAAACDQATKVVIMREVAEIQTEDLIRAISASQS